MPSKSTEANVWRCSVRKGVLRNFAKFTGKHLCQSLSFNEVVGLEALFNKVAGLRLCLTEHLWWLLLNQRQ